MYIVRARIPCFGLEVHKLGSNGQICSRAKTCICNCKWCFLLQPADVHHHASYLDSRCARHSQDAPQGTGADNVRNADMAMYCLSTSTCARSTGAIPSHSPGERAGQYFAPLLNNTDLLYHPYTPSSEQPPCLAAASHSFNSCRAASSSPTSTS
jgi:hypothetical protein